MRKLDLAGTEVRTTNARESRWRGNKSKQRVWLCHCDCGNADMLLHKRTLQTGKVHQLRLLRAESGLRSTGMRSIG